MTAGTGQAVAHPGIPISSAFFVSNDQLTDYPACEAQGVDRAMEHPDQMFQRVDDVWQSAVPELGGDLMIWAVAHVGGERIVTGNAMPAR